jgi:hypothetical protein
VLEFISADTGSGVLIEIVVFIFIFPQILVKLELASHLVITWI